MTQNRGGRRSPSYGLPEPTSPCYRDGHVRGKCGNLVGLKRDPEEEDSICLDSGCSVQAFAENSASAGSETEHCGFQCDGGLHISQKVASQMHNGDLCAKLIKGCGQSNSTSLSQFLKCHSYACGGNYKGYAGYMRYALWNSPLNRVMQRTFKKDHWMLSSGALTKGGAVKPQRYLPLNLSHFRKTRNFDSVNLAPTPFEATTRGFKPEWELSSDEEISERGIKVALVEVRILDLHMFLPVLLQKQRLIACASKPTHQINAQSNVVSEFSKLPGVKQGEPEGDERFKTVPASAVSKAVSGVRFLPKQAAVKSKQRTGDEVSEKSVVNLSCDTRKSSERTASLSTNCCPTSGKADVNIKRIVPAKGIIQVSDPTDWLVNVSLAVNLKGIRLATAAKERHLTKLMLRGAPRPTEHAECLVHGIKSRILLAKAYRYPSGMPKDHPDVTLVPRSSGTPPSGSESPQSLNDILVRIPVVFEPLRIYIPMRKGGRKSPFLPSIKIKISMVARSATLPHESDVSLGHCVLSLSRPVFSGVMSLCAEGGRTWGTHDLAGCVRVAIACRGIRFPKEPSGIQARLTNNVQSSNFHCNDICVAKADIPNISAHAFRPEDKVTADGDYPEQIDSAFVCAYSRSRLPKRDYVEELYRNSPYDATLPPSEINKWIAEYRHFSSNASLSPSEDSSSERSLSEDYVNAKDKGIAWPSLQVQNGPHQLVEATPLGHESNALPTESDAILTEHQNGRLACNSRSGHTRKPEEYSVTFLNRHRTEKSNVVEGFPRETTALTPTKRTTHGGVLPSSVAGNKCDRGTIKELSASYSSKGEINRGVDSIDTDLHGFSNGPSATEHIHGSDKPFSVYSESKSWETSPEKLNKMRRDLLGSDAPAWWGKNHSLQRPGSSEWHSQPRRNGVKNSHVVSPRPLAVGYLQRGNNKQNNCQGMRDDALISVLGWNPALEMQSFQYQAASELLYSFPPLTWPQSMATLMPQLVTKSSLKISDECSVIVVSIKGISNPSSAQFSKELPIIWKLVRKSALEDPEKYVETILNHVRATMLRKSLVSASSNKMHASMESTLMVHLHAVYDDGEFIHIFREYVEPPGGLLSDVRPSVTRCNITDESAPRSKNENSVSAKAIPLSERHAAIIVQQMLEALLALHSRGEVYVQMTPNGLFITQDGHIKLSLPSHQRFTREASGGTLGTAQKATSTVRTDKDTVYCRGIPLWTLAPEELDSVLFSTVLETGRHNVCSVFAGPSADMWRAGLTTFYLLSGIPPYATEQINTLKRLVFKRGSLGELLLNRLKGRSFQCLDFVASLLELNPCKRFCAEKALKHPWITTGLVCRSSSITHGALH